MNARAFRDLSVCTRDVLKVLTIWKLWGTITLRTIASDHKSRSVRAGLDNILFILFSKKLLKRTTLYALLTTQNSSMVSQMLTRSIWTLIVCVHQFSVLPCWCHVNFVFQGHRSIFVLRSSSSCHVISLLRIAIDSDCFLERKQLELKIQLQPIPNSRIYTHTPSTEK